MDTLKDQQLCPCTAEGIVVRRGFDQVRGGVGEAARHVQLLAIDDARQNSLRCLRRLVSNLPCDASVGLIPDQLREGGENGRCLLAVGNLERLIA